MKSPSFGNTDIKETPEINLENKQLIMNPDFSNNNGPSYIQRRDQMLKEDFANIDENEKQDIKKPDSSPSKSPSSQDKDAGGNGKFEDPNKMTEKYPGIFEGDIEVKFNH